MDSKRVIIFDTTLRDGEQSPGCKMDVGGKIQIARQLVRLGVDVIEAGFPIASPGDFTSVQRISREVEGPIIAGLARTRPEDIKETIRALTGAPRPRIHTFVATSDIHMEKKLRKPPAEVVRMAIEAVEQAKSFCDDVEFSPEDAARTGKDFLAEIVERVIEAGATTVNIPDTVGYSNPWEFGQLIEFLFERVPNISQAVVSVHCHNDLALAVANSLAGVMAGARQVEGCIIGIGERAGNAQLEAVVMNLVTRKDFFGFDIGVDTTQIGPTARLVASLINKQIPDTLPIVGASAFAHGAGIHQDGVIKDRRTYEIMTPKSVGWIGESLPLVKHSGRRALKDRLASLGYQFDDEVVDQIYGRFVELADLKTYVYNNDLHLIVQELRIRNEIRREKLFDLEDADIGYGPGYGAVTIRRNGQAFRAAGYGDGPFEALCKAIMAAITGHGEDLSALKLEGYDVIKGAGGPEAIAWVEVRVRLGDRLALGRSGDPDTIKASAKAFIYAINHLLQVPVAQLAAVL